MTKVADPYVQSVANVKPMMEIIGYTMPKADREYRGDSKTPYMAIQYGGGVAALTGSSNFIKFARKEGVNTDNSDELKKYAETWIEAIKKTLGKRINQFITNIGKACEGILEESGKDFLTYEHSDGFVVAKATHKKVSVCPAFKLRTSLVAKEDITFGSCGDSEVEEFWAIRDVKPSAAECVRTMNVNYIQGIDALVARTVVDMCEKMGLKGITSIHDCFRVRCSDAPKLHGAIAAAYVKVFVEVDQFDHIEGQLGGKGSLNMLKKKNIVTREAVESEDSYYFCI